MLALSAAMALGAAAAHSPSTWPGDPTGLARPPRAQPPPASRVHRRSAPLQRLRELALSQVLFLRGAIHATGVLAVNRVTPYVHAHVAQGQHPCLCVDD